MKIPFKGCWRQPMVLLLIVALAACASTNVRESERLDLQRDLIRLQSNPEVTTRAPAELAAARAAVVAIDEAHGADAQSLVVIAQQRIRIAQVVADNRKLEAQRADLERTHSQLLLQAARRDARQARRELEHQRLQAQIEAEEAQRQMQEAEAAREAGDQATHDAEAARKVAAQSRRIAQTQARAAALAKKEAELTRSLQEAEQNAAPAATGSAAPVSLHLSARSFKFGEAALDPAGKARLSRIIDAAAANPSGYIRITAGTDSDGSDLARQRAKAVQAALVEAGVAASRIDIAAEIGSGSGIDVMFTR